MSTPWSLAVLPAGVENAVPLDSGVAATAAAARAAAVEALLAAARSAREPEYRLAIGRNQIIVSMGLDDEGDVDLAGLREALGGLAFAA